MRATYAMLMSAKAQLLRSSTSTGHSSQAHLRAATTVLREKKMDQRKEMGIYASDFSKKVKTSDVSEKALHPSPAFSASNARVNKIRMNKVVGKPLYTMQPVKSAGHRFREQKEARRKGLDLDEEAVLNANINKNMIAGGTGENKSSTAPLVAMLALGLFGAASVAHGNLFESLQSFVTQTEGVLPSQNIDVYVTPEAHAKQPLWLQRQR